MNQQIEAIKRLKIIHERLLSSYSKQRGLTDDVFIIISEMLSVDYNSIVRGGKRISVFKDYMFSWIKHALENDGHKNYMLELISIFQDETIFNYLYSSFGNKKDELKEVINGSYNRLFAWQGLEGCEWKRLERIENLFRNIR